MKYIVTLLLAFVYYGVSAQNLSKTERRIIQTIEKNNDGAISFLEKVVNINSGSMNLEGVKEVGDVFYAEFEKLGFDVDWHDMSDVERAGHLFAEAKGKKGKRILLIGHLDTVFPKDSPFQKFEKRDGKVYGPGAADMKGGDVIILYALKALYETGALKDAQIIVAFTGDEEKPGKPMEISRKHLRDAAQRSDVALGFEGASGLDYAVVGRRGSSGWRLETRGVRAHSSAVFSENVGAGAIFEMGRILTAFYEDVRGEEFLTFNPGVLMGGTDITYDTANNRGTTFGKSNVVAQQAVVSGGLRFITEEQKEKTREKMSAIVAGNYPNTTASISFTDSYPPMPPSEGNMTLLRILSDVSTDMGGPEIKPWDPAKRGAADLSFAAPYVDCLGGLGVMGSGAHTPNETIDLSTFELQTQKAALLIYRLINSK